MCWKVHELEKLLTLLKKINQQEKLNVDTKVFDAWRMDLGGKLWAYFLGSHDPGTAWLHVNYEIFRLKYLLLSHYPVCSSFDFVVSALSEELTTVARPGYSRQRRDPAVHDRRDSRSCQSVVYLSAPRLQQDRTNPRRIGPLSTLPIHSSQLRWSPFIV